MKLKQSPCGDKLTCEPIWWNSCSLWCVDRKFHISEVIKMSNGTSVSPVPRCMSCEATPQPQLAVALPTDTEYKSGITWLIFHLEPAAPPKHTPTHIPLCVMYADLTYCIRRSDMRFSLAVTRTLKGFLLWPSLLLRHHWTTKNWADPEPSHKGNVWDLEGRIRNLEVSGSSVSGTRRSLLEL